MGTNTFLKLLPDMVAFLRVAELGSFRAAAAQLGVTPPAVSRQVMRLEKALGVQLMQRTTRQLRMTAAGLEALTHCSELVAAAQETMQVGQRLNSHPQGLVRLSAPKAFARHVLQPLVLTFLQRFPEVNVQLMVTDRDVDPVREGVDLVVRLTKQPPEGLSARPLMGVQHRLYATPRYLAEHKAITHPHDLALHSCLSLGELPHDNHWCFQRNGDPLDTAEVAVQGRFVANHSEMRLDAVLAHLGVGCIPNFVALPALQCGDVVPVLPDWEFQATYHGTAYVLWPPSRFLPPKCRVLIDHLTHSPEKTSVPKN